ncbi:MAG: type II 3-dehydroquinate dehydratase [Thermodesulfobacteriota bacterium]
MKILVINGPNLNTLGKREPDIYGNHTLEDINKLLKSEAKNIGKDVTLEFFQSNSEGEIVSRIQDAFENFDGVLINPAAYTHTSVAIRDALLSTGLPTVEVHISNIFKREEFRQKSFVSAVSIGVVSGFGLNSYLLGLKGLCDFISSN